MDEKLRVMIADDEPMVCVVVQHSIHWQELGMELTGVAHDGLELLEKIKEKKPDIVITDISMPELSGLELIEQIRKENLECKFIIISGYRQFEYAHKALKNNVDDYLLKPINEQELNESLLRLKTEITGERAHGKEAVERLLINNKKDKENIRRVFLNEILNSKDRKESIKELSEEYGISLGEGIYQAVIAKFDTASQENLDDGLTSIRTKIVSIFCKIFENDFQEILVDARNDRILFGVYYAKENACMANAGYKKFFEYAKNIVELFMGFTLTVGVGEKHNTMEELAEAFSEAADAIHFRILEGINRIIFYENLKIPQRRWTDCEKEEIREKLSADFEIQNVEAFKHEIASLYFVDRKSCNASELVDMSKDIVGWFFEKQKSLENEIENADYQYNLIIRKICNSVSIRDLRKVISDSLSAIMKDLEEKRKCQKKRPVRETLNYISQHYKEEITLEIIANEVKLSPVYLSNIFKKETGEQNYIRIQQFRFPNRFQLEIRYDREDYDVLEAIMPKMTLQPIIENAVSHGFERSRKKAKIVVGIVLTEKNVNIIISDNGTGMEREVLEKLNQRIRNCEMERNSQRRHNGIAMPNVNRRLQLMFGEDYGIHISSIKDTGTDVEIHIPFCTDIRQVM